MLTPQSKLRKLARLSGPHPQTPQTTLKKLSRYSSPLQPPQGDEDVLNDTFECLNDRESLLDISDIEQEDPYIVLRRSVKELKDAAREYQDAMKQSNHLAEHVKKEMSSLVHLHEDKRLEEQVSAIETTCHQLQSRIHDLDVAMKEQEHEFQLQQAHIIEARQSYRRIRIMWLIFGVLSCLYWFSE